MPLQIVQGDITKIPCDAIVNAAKPSLLGGGGVDGAIHKAAGPGMLLECMTLGGCKTGQAKITKGYNLPSQFVIHTVGPKWRGGNCGEREQLASCYSESLKLAYANGCSVVAVPLISAGEYGYPEDQVLQLATEVITEFLSETDMLVYIVVYNPGTMQEKKTAKRKHILLVALVIVIAFILLAVIFRDSIEAIIRNIHFPIGP